MNKLPIYVTGNLDKLKELKKYLNIDLEHQKLDLDEIQSLNLAEVVEHKAKSAYAIIGKPVLVEDTSLTFNALGKLPGPLIKWFLNELGNKGLCSLLDNYTDRSAIASVMFALYDGSDLQTFYGEKAGSIAQSPRGEKSFGWNPTFIPQGHTKTWGEMNDEEKSASSIRKIALTQLKKHLESQ
jgi:non-canonical purine NTP pyrophosphatase (RdgB/HAM1 family)